MLYEKLIWIYNAAFAAENGGPPKTLFSQEILLSIADFATLDPGDQRSKPW